MLPAPAHSLKNYSHVYLWPHARIPAYVIGDPELEVSYTDGGEEHVGGVVYIERIHKLL